VSAAARGSFDQGSFFPPSATLLHPAISSANLATSASARLRAAPVVGRDGDVFEHPAVCSRQDLNVCGLTDEEILSAAKDEGEAEPEDANTLLPSTQLDQKKEDEERDATPSSSAPLSEIRQVVQRKAKSSRETGVQTREEGSQEELGARKEDEIKGGAGKERSLREARR